MVIFKALAWVLSLAAVVTWLVALVRWDGSIPCDRSQCGSRTFWRFPWTGCWVKNRTAWSAVCTAPSVFF